VDRRPAAQGDSRAVMRATVVCTRLNLGNWVWAAMPAHPGQRTNKPVSKCRLSRRKCPPLYNKLPGVVHNHVQQELIRRESAADSPSRRYGPAHNKASGPGSSTALSEIKQPTWTPTS